MTVSYDDLSVGWTETYGPVEMDREAMIAFAEQFDPQPMHLDPAAAREKGYDDVFASGLYTVATAMRLLVEQFLNDSTNLGGLGMDELRWHAPVYPGESLSVTHEVTAMRVSESDDSRGIVTREIEVTGDGTPVCSWAVSILMGR